MKKTLLGLVLGGALFGNVVAQDSNKIYEYDIYAGGIWKVGSAMCSSDSVNLRVGKVEDINFYREGNKYHEELGHKGEREEYDYFFDGAWVLDKYSCDNEETYKARDNKVAAVGKSMPLDVILGTEIFSQFEGRSIPDTIKLVAFAYPYTFVQSDVRYKKDRVEVDYRVDNYDNHPADTRSLDGDITAVLKKDADGSYRLAGGSVPVSWKTWLGPVSFDLDIREK
jgi:hypothetical protein